MNVKRAPMTPPHLPGFTYLEVLGSGGFADVYLYEQQLPRRRVAVKVLLTERISTGSVAEFTAEANVMAMLSTHPAIVTIYQAGVAHDGRPYLVMEYCPKPNLQVRYRREPFSVAESLRVGIQVAAAVETAHRAGVLHRDIKPANILVTEYNRPALTDFGIASTTSAAAESEGLSIPWSPPESFADVPRSDPRSDVYALGATVYTLLAGRYPFEMPGQRNSAAELIHRIETAPLPALRRPDAPESLVRALERAMAKSPADRAESALAFARALQKAQIELAHSVTPIDILDDGAPEDAADEDDDGLTRVRGVVSISPETSPAAGLTRPSATTAPSGARGGYQPPMADTVVRGAPDEVEATLRRDRTELPAALDATVLRLPSTAVGSDAVAEAPHPETGAPGPSRSRKRQWIAVGAGALVIVAIIVAVSLPGLLGGQPQQPAAPSQTAEPMDPLAGVVPEPRDVAGEVTAGGVRFSWTNPDPQEGDSYIVGTVSITGEDPDLESIAVPEVTVPADPSQTTCIDVILVRGNGQSSEPVRGCVP